VLILALLLQAAPDDPRHRACVALAASNPAAAHAQAAGWQGGGFLARQCDGLAYAAEQRWSQAADAFEAAARAAELARDARAAALWAQAGNARLADGEADRARLALTAALAAGTLTGLALGEAQLDLARAAVALGDLPGARASLDLAVVNAADDPLAWLLSATLARRQGDLTRARTDIAEALKRSADDASVQLEAGNIAAAAGDEAGARAAWTQATRLAPGAPAGRSAAAALQQFGPTPTIPRPRPTEGR
jgi:predicted negative regulator of RcsB-dependent stress response